MLEFYVWINNACCSFQIQIPEIRAGQNTRALEGMIVAHHIHGPQESILDLKL